MSAHPPANLKNRCLLRFLASHMPHLSYCSSDFLFLRAANPNMRKKAFALIPSLLASSIRRCIKTIQRIFCARFPQWGASRTLRKSLMRSCSWLKRTHYRGGAACRWRLALRQMVDDKKEYSLHGNQKTAIPLVAAVLFLVLLAPGWVLAQDNQKENPMNDPVSYRTVQVDGLSIFYRNAGPA